MIEYLEMEGSGKEIIYRKKFVRQPSKADLLKNDMRTELLFGPKTIKELASSLQVAGLVIDKTIRENSDKFSLLNGRVHLSRSISTDSSLRPLRPEKGGNLFATGLRPGATDKDQCLYNQQFTAVASESCLKSQ
jgi:hypothetical protein